MIDPLRYGYALIANDCITANRLAFGWAQCCLENAHGAAIYNHNWGNLTVLPSFSGDYYELTTKERTHKDEANPANDVWKELTLRYRSLPSHEDGAAMYWSKILGKFNHHDGLMDLVDSGAWEYAVYHLSADNYFTARPGPYANTVAALCKSFPHRFPEYT